MQTYMIIEAYKPGKTEEIYQRLAERGRMMPPAVVYVNSWIEENLSRCYQVMISPSPHLLDEWIDNWKDLIDFEVIKVLSSQEVSDRMTQ